MERKQKLILKQIEESVHNVVGIEILLGDKQQEHQTKMKEKTIEERLDKLLIDFRTTNDHVKHQRTWKYIYQLQGEYWHEHKRYYDYADPMSKYLEEDETVKR